MFTDSFPEEWKRDKDFNKYFTELCSFSFDKLTDEPDRLSGEKTRLLSETQRLAFDNYKAFIQTADCTKEIFEDFLSVKSHVSGLLDKLPTFVDVCHHFQEKAEDITKQRKKTSVMLSKHTQLLEILEIPQVMDTCVRNSYHDEALELAAFVKRLENKHEDIPIIKSIAVEVEDCLKLMLNQLFQQLKSNIQLPTCLKVVGYLRRMNIFTDHELRLRFLQARDSWFQTTLSAIPTEDGYKHIMKTIELSRVHLFDIITQFKAVFPEDDSPAKRDPDRPSESGIFHCWVNEKIWQFVHTLEADLAKGVGGHMDSIINQCMYFGLSFSRIGADFRPILVPILYHSVLGSFKKTVEIGKSEFSSSMKKFSLLSMPGATITTQTPSLTKLPLATSSAQTPPLSLLEFPPLGILANAMVVGFNELRLVVPLSGATVVVKEIRQVVVTVADSLLEFYKSDHSSFSTKEEGLFSRCCQVFYCDFCCWLSLCVEALFPSQSVDFLASCAPHPVQSSKEEDQQEVMVGAGRGGPVDLSLRVDDVVQELKTICPEAFERPSESEHTD